MLTKHERDSQKAIV